MPSLASLALLVLALVLIVQEIRRYLGTRRFVSRFPTLASSPKPFIGHADQFLGKKPEEILTFLMSVCYRLDPKFRKIAAVLGSRRMVFLLHPELAESLLSSPTVIAKSLEYNALRAWLGDGLLLSKGNKWRARRKLLTPAFHFKILDQSMAVFNSQANKLSEDFGEIGNSAFDVFPLAARCTLRVMLESAMGVIPEGKQMDAYYSHVGRMLHVVQTRQRSPWLWPSWTFELSGYAAEERKHLSVLQGFTESVIRERRAETKDRVLKNTKEERLAFLDLLLQLETPEGGKLSNDEIREEVDTFMFEGHDTTACSLTWTMLLLANHPEYQEKAFQEQRELFGDDLGKADVKMEQLSQMRYLEAVLKESLRLYPSVPVLGRTLAEGEEMVIDGEKVGQGTSLLIFAYFMHRNPAVWSKPEEFIPERFLVGSSAEVERHPYSYVPFSAGPRNCIGQRFALMEEKTIMSKLLRRYELLPYDAVEDVKATIEVITRPAHGVWIKVKPRNDY